MRKQKKSNNKGFSLVELIVVIAIMAVLIGVLAPTVISNIEKSRESKDLNRLDNIYSAIQTAYGDEKGNEAGIALGNSPIELTSTTLASKNDFYKLVNEYLNEELPTFISSSAKGDKIFFSISDKGKIRVWLSDDNNGATVDTGSKSGNEFEVE